jgi:hypothetical protein
MKDHSSIVGTPVLDHHPMVTADEALFFSLGFWFWAFVFCIWAYLQKPKKRERSLPKSAPKPEPWEIPSEHWRN